jgi:hypothetical protein
MIGHVYTLVERGAYYFEEGSLSFAPLRDDGSVDWAGAAQVDLFSLSSEEEAEAKAARARLEAADDLAPLVPVRLICLSCQVAIGPSTAADAARLAAMGHRVIEDNDAR